MNPTFELQAKNNSEKFYNSKKFKWIINIVAPILFYLIPVSQEFTADMKLFFAITLFVIINWAFELMPMAITAFILPIVYVNTNLVTPAQALSPWTTSLPWLFMGGMIISSVFENTGLMRRLALWSIIKAGGTYKGILIGLLFTGIIMTLIVPSTSARISLFLPLAYGVCNSLDAKPNSKEGAGIMLSAGFMALTPVTVVDGAYLVSYPIARNFGLYQSWIEHLIEVGLLTFLLTGIYTIMLLILFKPTSSIFMPENKEKTREYFKNEYSKLGEMKANEKKMLGILCLMILFLCTGSIHKIDAGWLFALTAFSFFLPGIKIGSENDFQKINLKMVLIMTGAMSIGAVSVSLGAGTLIANKLVPLLAGGKFWTTAFAWLMGVIVNFFLTPLAAQASLTGPLIEAARATGANPYVMIHAFGQGLEQVLLPYEYVLVLMIFSYKMFTLKTFIKIFAIKMAVNFIFLMLICVPYWTLLGIF